MKESNLHVERVDDELVMLCLPKELRTKKLTDKKSTDKQLKRLLAFLVNLSCSNEVQEIGYCYASDNDVVKAIGCSKDRVVVYSKMLLDLELIKGYERGSQRGKNKQASASKFWLSDDLFPHFASPNNTVKSQNNTVKEVQNNTVKTPQNNTVKLDSQLVDNEEVIQNNTVKPLQNNTVKDFEKEYRNITKYNITKYNDNVIVDKEIINVNVIVDILNDIKELKEQVSDLTERLDNAARYIKELESKIPTEGNSHYTATNTPIIKNDFELSDKERSDTSERLGVIWDNIRKYDRKYQLKKRRKYPEEAMEPLREMVRLMKGGTLTTSQLNSCKKYLTQLGINYDEAIRASLSPSNDEGGTTAQSDTEMPSEGLEMPLNEESYTVTKCRVRDIRSPFYNPLNDLNTNLMFQTID